MATAPSSIPWHQRLDTRVAASVSLIMALALGTALMATTRAVTMRALTSAQGDLDAARKAFDHLVVDRAEFASSQAALITAVPVFRAHLTEPQLAADVASVGAMADEYRKTMEAEFAIVSGASGQWLASPGWPQGAPPSAISATIAEAVAGRSGRRLVDVGGRLFLVVSEPARFAEEVLGTFTVGLPLNDEVAKRLGEETACSVNFASDGRLVASSLPSSQRSGLSQVLASGVTGTSTARADVRRIGDGEFAVGVFPAAPATLGPLSAPASANLILLEDWAPTADFITDSRRRLSLLAAVVFFPSLGIALIFSRRMMRPLDDLVRAAGDIAGGNWDRRIEPSGGAETQMMARAFNEMTASLQHWVEEARKRDDQFRQAQKMEAIGRLAGGVAHDFNNLLTAINGYGELLRDQLADGDSRRDDIDEILKASARAASLTRQLLAFSRRQVVKTETMSLGLVVKDLNQLLRRLIGEDVELRSAVAQDLWMVRGDVRQFEQAIINLAVNARDAMPKGGELSLELTNVVFGDESGLQHPRLAPGGYVHLAVSDTGTGMDADTVARIFEPFFTTKEVGRGTGLGLAMVYGVVEQASGIIDVDSTPGRGTTFHIYLPRVAAEADAATDAAAKTITEPLRGTETILLVEDDQHVNALVARALTRAGYSVVSASNGDEALAKLRLHPAAVDLLLTDVIMPSMNGRELSERIVAERPDIRVLFMSGYSDDAILRHGVQTETARFIQKPFSMDALAAKMREALTDDAAAS